MIILILLLSEQESRSSRLSTRVKQPVDTYGANILRLQEELVQIKMGETERSEGTARN